MASHPGFRGSVQPGRYKQMMQCVIAKCKPLRYLMVVASTEERFWAKVQKAEGCWMWTAARTRDGLGYGYFSVCGKPIGAHVFSWRLFWGREVPVRLRGEKCCVMHACDNPGCVNPHHLVLATRSENIIDSVWKGRHSSVIRVRHSSIWRAINREKCALSLVLRGSAGS